MENSLKTELDSNEWLRDLFDRAHDLIQMVHIDGTLVYVNKSWSTVLGYSLEEIVGKSIFTFIDKSYIFHYKEYRAQIISGLKSDEPVIFALITKTGQKIFVEGLVTLKTIDGKPLYLTGIFRDISVRLNNENQLKSLNEELRENEENIKKLLIHAPDAIIVIDQESKINFWNPKAEQVFGWRAEEVLNKDLSSIIIPPPHRQAHLKGMKRYLSTGEAHVLDKTIEITSLNRNGNEFFISLTISRTLQDGRIAFIAFIRDIQEQKKNQIELEQKKAALEHSNANLEAFAYAASHDLKEPIRKILNFSGRLKERLKEKLDEEDLHFLQRMENSAQRMNALIEDLLNYSSVSAGVPPQHEIDLNQVLNGVLEDLELEIEYKKAVIKVSPLPIVKGNPRQLQQLFQNLVNNALKYSSHSNIPEITIISHSPITKEHLHYPFLDKEDIKQFHLIEIKDNGIGFEQKYAEKIFNVFTRLGGNSDQRGTGVGLSIARKVAENHKGYIWAESEPGKGATFKLLLPVEN
ncbi:MAG: hypothetical protein NVS9B7_17300 [Flavisolibacter sp.]